MESKSKDIRELIAEIGKLHQQMLSLQEQLHKLRNYDTDIYNGTEFAITSSKLKPDNIKYVLT